MVSMPMSIKCPSDGPTRKKIVQLFSELGASLGNRKSITCEIYDPDNVHAFYRLAADDSMAVHVEGSVRLSDEHEAFVFARLVDYNLMQRARDDGTPIGREIGATIQELPSFNDGIRVPYSLLHLERMLVRDVPELS